MDFIFWISLLMFLSPLTKAQRRLLSAHFFVHAMSLSQLTLLLDFVFFSSNPIWRILVNGSLEL